MAEDIEPRAVARAPAVIRRPRRARWSLRMHPLFLLLDQLPKLLVERRPLPRSRDPAPGLPVAGRQPRRSDWRAARRARGSIPAVPLPHDYELRQRLPQGPQPGQGDRRDQEADRRTGRVSDSGVTDDRPELMEDGGVPTGATPDPDNPGWYSWGDFPRG